jgi:hypothetical protein
MRGTYGYSFDRDTFHGTYKTRDEALQEALRHTALIGPDLVIWVGQRMGGDTQSAGHARHLIGEMRRRAREFVGEGGRDYLRDVTADQIKDLEGALETTINRWLTNYKLLPKYEKIGAVSEHPVPNAPQVTQGNGSEW